MNLSLQSCTPLLFPKLQLCCVFYCSPCTACTQLKALRQCYFMGLALLRCCYQAVTLYGLLWFYFTAVGLRYLMVTYLSFVPEFTGLFSLPTSSCIKQCYDSETHATPIPFTLAKVAFATLFPPTPKELQKSHSFSMNQLPNRSCTFAPPC